MYAFCVWGVINNECHCKRDAFFGAFCQMDAPMNAQMRIPRKSQSLNGALLLATPRRSAFAHTCECSKAHGDAIPISQKGRGRLLAHRGPL